MSQLCRQMLETRNVFWNTIHGDFRRLYIVGILNINSLGELNGQEDVAKCQRKNQKDLFTSATQVQKVQKDLGSATTHDHDSVCVQIPSVVCKHHLQILKAMTCNPNHFLIYKATPFITTLSDLHTMIDIKIGLPWPSSSSFTE